MTAARYSLMFQAEPGITSSELRQRLGSGSTSPANHMRVLDAPYDA